MVEVIHEPMVPGVELGDFEAIKRISDQGTEYWSARDLQVVAGYEQWRRFQESIERAVVSATNQGISAHDHFADAGKLVRVGSGAERDVQDYHITRYGCYLVFQNGDPRKPEIAAAQGYFAIRTREAEVQREETFEEKTLTVLHGLTQKVEEQRRALAVAEPKAEAYDEFLADGGDYDRRAAASILSRRHGINLGQNKLTDLLVEWGWIGKDRRPKYPYTSREYFASRPYKDPILNERTGQYFTPAPQLRITAKCIDAIANKIKRNEAQKGIAA